MDLLSDTGVRLAKAGYAVSGIDCEGHGKSAGTRCYIKNFDDLVMDSVTFFRSVAGTYSEDVCVITLFLIIMVVVKFAFIFNKFNKL